MGVPSDAAIPAGDFVRRLDDTNSEVAQSRTARRGQATSVGAGGTRWHSGGSAVFEGGGGVEVRDGGNVFVKDGGTLAAEYLSGRTGVKFGPLIITATGAPDGHGLLVQEDTDEALDIFRAKLGADGQRTVYIGSIPAPAGAVDEFKAWALHAEIHTYENALLLQSHDDGDIEILSDDRLWLYADGNLDMNVGGTWDADVVGNLDFDAQGTALVQANTTMQLLCDGQAALGGTTGTFLQPESTGLAANMHMAVDGRVYRSTSTRRYKTDIRDADFDPDAVLQLQPRSWLPGPIPASCPDWLHSQHKDAQPCPAEQDPEPADPNARRQVGFIAEELVDIGLSDFVEFNADGQPEAIYYDRLTAALVPLLQSQQQQIAALTERLDELESTIAAGP